MEAYGLFYDEKSATIFNGKIPATFAQVTQIVKDTYPRTLTEIMEENPHWIQILAQDSNKKEILKIFAVQLQFDSFLNTLKSAGGKVDHLKKLFIHPDGSSEALESLNSKYFLPMQEKFLIFIQSQGYCFNFNKDELTKEIIPATIWQAELLKRGFHQSYVYPIFDEVKSGLKPLMDYSEFIKVLKREGYQVNSALYEKWFQ